MAPRLTLSDGTIRIRPLQAGDAPSLYAAVRESLADLKPWMSWAHDGYSLIESQDWIEAARIGWDDSSYYGFAILDAADETLLGSVSLSHINPVYHFCNLGYWVRSTRRGQGIAARASRLAARFAFEQLELVRVEIVVAVGNAASLRAAEKSGARREGVLRNRMVIRETACDAVMFSLLPQDLA